MQDDPSSSELWSVAEALADTARAETLKYFRRPGLIAESKTDAFDPVTIADRAAEQAMRAVLAERRPDDAILGEEYSHSAGTSGWTWILDPIDGTRGFISGTPTWGVLIAVADSTGPKLGIIDQPFIGERFCGGFGRADYTGPQGETSLGVRHTTGLDRAILFSTFPEIGSQDERAAFESVASEVRLVRYGTDCYAYGLLALGQIDLVIEAGLQAYDIAGPMAVVEAAGGIVTNWQGGPAQNGGQVIAAASPDLHKAALERLNG